MPRILLVDDDVELTAMLADYLADEGFVVDVAGDGISGGARALADGIDLVVLDVMLPDRSGIETLREIRLTSNVPVLMLTARGDEIDKVVGLELGADDYVPKPCTPRELAARIRAILRRTTRFAAPASAAAGSTGDMDEDSAEGAATKPANLTAGGAGKPGSEPAPAPVRAGQPGGQTSGGPGGGRGGVAGTGGTAAPVGTAGGSGFMPANEPASDGGGNDVLVAGSLRVWPRSRRVQWQGQDVDLTSTQFSVLEVLARHAGTVVSKAELSKLALGRPLGRFDRSIDVHISILRQRLDGPGGGDELIKTVRGIGYQLAVG